MDVIERGAPGTRHGAVELAERSRGFLDDLAEVRATASADLADGIRELRGESRTRLARPDVHYPEHLAEAVAELGHRYLRRTHDLTYAAAARALTGLDAAVPPLVVEWAPSSISPPPHRGRWGGEERTIAVSSVIGAATLARWPMFAGTLPAPVTAGVSVSLVLAVAWWLASTKRCAAERASLERWTNEVLNDTRSTLESAFAQRIMDAQRQMRHVLQHQAARLDAQTAAANRPVPASAGVYR
jgi:hypothetical protein